MKTAGRYTCARGAQRLKLCQIASNYEPVDVCARGKFFRFIRLSFSVGRAPTEIFSTFHPLSPRKPPNTTSSLYPCSSLAPPFPPLTYFPWKCKFRVTDIVSQTGDISHRRRGREVDVRVRKDRSYTVNISWTNFSISSLMSSGNLDDDKVDSAYAIKKIVNPLKD